MQKPLYLKLLATSCNKSRLNCNFSKFRALLYNQLLRRFKTFRNASWKGWYAKTLVNKIIVGWLELKDADYRFHSICLLDDTVEEDVWREPYPLLKRRTDTVQFWEERDELLEILV